MIEVTDRTRKSFRAINLITGWEDFVPVLSSNIEPSHRSDRKKERTRLKIRSTKDKAMSYNLKNGVATHAA